ncbi:MAG TPA: ABC-2 family transporter protein [Pseudonocardiaceae bacterium]
MAERLAVYRRLVGAAFRSQLAYRTSFVLQCVGQALVQVVDLVAILVLFGHVDAMAGFAVREVVLVYGIAGVAFGLADMAVGQLDALPRYIREGTLDAVLLRPLSPLWQLCASEVALRRLGRVLSAGGALAYALATTGVDWTPARVLLAVAAPLAGAVILSSIWVVACSVTFWTVEGREVANAVTYGSNLFTSYPIGVYGPWLRRLMGFAIPGAFVAYFPALALLGRPDPLGLPAFLQWSSPVVAAAAALVAAGIWRTALRHYRGTGS